MGISKFGPMTSSCYVLIHPASFFFFSLQSKNLRAFCPSFFSLTHRHCRERCVGGRVMVFIYIYYLFLFYSTNTVFSFSSSLNIFKLSFNFNFCFWFLCTTILVVLLLMFFFFFIFQSYSFNGAPFEHVFLPLTCEKVKLIQSSIHKI